MESDIFNKSLVSNNDHNQKRKNNSDSSLNGGKKIIDLNELENILKNFLSDTQQSVSKSKFHYNHYYNNDKNKKSIIITVLTSIRNKKTVRSNFFLFLKNLTLKYKVLSISFKS
jgi:hypothetical protein